MGAFEGRQNGRGPGIGFDMSCPCLMEVLLTTGKTCDPSPGPLPLRTYLRDAQWLPKESNQTPP